MLYGNSRLSILIHAFRCLSGIINITVRDFSFSSTKIHGHTHKKDYNQTEVTTDYKISLLLRLATSETEAQKDLEKAIESGKCLLGRLHAYPVTLYHMSAFLPCPVV